MRPSRIVMYSSVFLLLVLTGGCAEKTAPNPQADAVANLFKSPEFKKKRDMAAQGYVAMPAVAESEPLWKIKMPLAGSNITGMHPVETGWLLVVYEGGRPELIDTRKGALLWSYKDIWQTDAKGVRRNSSYSFVASSQGAILLNARRKDGSTLFAIEAETGKTRWTLDLDFYNAPDFLFFHERGVLVAIQHDKSSAQLSAIGVSDGTVRWRKKYGYSSGLKNPPLPLIALDKLVVAYEGIEMIAAENGRPAWTRADIVLGGGSPQPKREDDAIYAIDSANALVILQESSGRPVLTVKLQRTFEYTNIYPYGDRIYLRGVIRENEASLRYVFTAVRRSDGKELWSYTDTDPSVSNIIDEEGMVFFSSPSTVVALDRASGKKHFAATASQLGKSYPVQIRKFKNRVVYVGELVIAAFDVKSGAQAYKLGFDPLSQTAHMDALDQQIDRIGKYLADLPILSRSGIVLGNGLSSYYLQQYQTSQNLSNNYRAMERQQFSSYRSGLGESYLTQAQISGMKAQVENASANINFSMGTFFFSAENMLKGAAEYSARDRAKFQDLVNTRRSLLALYQSGLNELEYALRVSKEAGYVELSIVHLPTGRLTNVKLTRQNLSPNLLHPDALDTFGLHVKVDYEKGIVYHHALKRLPDNEQPSLTDKDRYHSAYFVADKIVIPK